MLEVDGLSIRFSGLDAVSGLSFRLDPGMVFAIIGPNGAGKTSVFNAISGFVAPAGGTIRFEGRAITGLAPHLVAACGIRRTFQNNGLLRDMTVLENVLTGLELSTPAPLWGVVAGWPGAIGAERRAMARAHAMLERTGIADLTYRTAGDLAFGQQRLVEIARAMVGGARLIMLDEPAVGLSVPERAHLEQSLRALAAQGVGVLLVEHVQELVMAVADRVLVLDYGRKIAEGPPAAVRRDQAVLEAYLGQV